MSLAGAYPGIRSEVGAVFGALLYVGNQGARRYAFERTYRIDIHLSLCFLKRTGCILACLFLRSGCSFLKLSTRHLSGDYFRRVTPASVALCRARGLLQRDGQE